MCSIYVYTTYMYIILFLSNVNPWLLIVIKCSLCLFTWCYLSWIDLEADSLHHSVGRSVAATNDVAAISIKDVCPLWGLKRSTGLHGSFGVIEGLLDSLTFLDFLTFLVLLSLPVNMSFCLPVILYLGALSFSAPFFGSGMGIGDLLCFLISSLFLVLYFLFVPVCCFLFF